MEKGGTLDETADVADLRRQVEKLAKINAALMQRVERSMDHQANAYSMFQTAIGLENQVRARTEELKSALSRLERANDQLTQARDAAERANRFKTRFFTSVGHDLLQPLHAARLSLSAMSEEEGDAGDRRLVEQVDHALSTIEEMLRTILDLSKLDAGVLKPTLHTVALGDIFQSLALDLQPIAAANELELTIRPSKALVTSDAMMLRRILQNLLANAVQYTEHGRILLAARRRGERVRLEVWDTGPGIAPSEQERIFDEFERGAAAERSHGGGFGIGLAIISRMAEALGHKIELCSKVGRGTCFSVDVPYAGEVVKADACAARSAAAIQSYGLAQTRAVVIDNDVAVLDAMRTLLQRWGCDARYSVGISGIDALIMNEPHFRPDIVLADFHLEAGRSGLEAVERVRAVWGDETAAIVITADRTDAVVADVLAAKCELLRKPVKPAELRALVMHLLS